MATKKIKARAASKKKVTTKKSIKPSKTTSKKKVKVVSKKPLKVTPIKKTVVKKTSTVTTKKIIAKKTVQPLSYPWSYDGIYGYLYDSRNIDLLKNSLFGLERETLRTDRNGQLSEKAHPKTLGSKLTHPYISTDFAEAQLELVTPALESKYQTAKFIEETEAFISQNLSQELLWPLSMPCKLPKDNEIASADFGTSISGQRKNVYRNGLSLRYSSKMQTICGIHYNFSFGEKFWDALYTKLSPNVSKQDFISASYMGMARNFLRYNWLNTYLFGASPTVDKSFLNSTWLSPLSKLAKDTYYGKYATSLRMSRIGYSNKSDCQNAIKYEDLPTFIDDLKHGLTTPKKEYQKFGVYKNGKQIQLNANILQTESEHYSSVRPKQIVQPGETVVQALQRRGVQYLEIRSVDINPYALAGIDGEYIDFMHILLIHCILTPSPIFDVDSYCEMVENQGKVAFEGRRPKLKLKNNGNQVFLKEWGEEMIESLKKTAVLLDKLEGGMRYANILDAQIAKLQNPDLTPSARILSEMRHNHETHMDFGLRLAKDMFRKLMNYKLPATTANQFTKMAVDTVKQQMVMEAESKNQLLGYEDLELSTQLVIREAMDRNLEVEILDRNDNFIRLSKGSKVEYLKQATKTDTDSYMTFLIMENKLVTKKILSEKGINVPEGGSYTNLEDALNDYSHYIKDKVIVKPVSTNFGIGIQAVSPGNPELYKTAIKHAFEHDSSVIVEKFYKGPEYRFLVIGEKLIAVCNRVPANVMGDGQSTVSELVDLKNNDPKFPKPKDYRIEKGRIESTVLAEQKMTFESVPKKGQIVFLRQNSNVSTGGDPLDATNLVSTEYKKIAINAAKAVEANICGVDMIIADPKATPTPENHAVIELNFNPILSIHAFPYGGQPRNVAGPLLDYLGF